MSKKEVLSQLEEKQQIPQMDIQISKSKKDNSFTRSHPVIKRKENSKNLNSASSSGSQPVQQNVSSSKLKIEKRKDEWIGTEIDEDLLFIMESAIDNRSEPEIQKPKSRKKKDAFGDSSCKHLETINENGVEVCVDCSTVLYDKITHKAEWRYYGDNDNQHSYDPSRCQYVKKAEKGIRTDLVKMGFTPQIIDIADALYNKVTNGDIKRSDLRKGIEFACVFQAYKNIGQPQLSENLQKIFKISRKKMSKGLTYFRTNLPKDEQSVITYITAEHYIPIIAEKFQMKKEHIDNILKLYKTLENKCNSINTSTPQSVSSGLVYYYLTTLSAPVTAKKFGEEVKLSEITITKIKEEIQNILAS